MLKEKLKSKKIAFIILCAIIVIFIMVCVATDPVFFIQEMVIQTIKEEIFGFFVGLIALILLLIASRKWTNLNLEKLVLIVAVVIAIISCIEFGVWLMNHDM